MIRTVLDSARLILQIALVVGIGMLIFWWNPAGIFGGKLKLQPTANLHAEVKELGELITASYFGEVISTIEEVQIETAQASEFALLASESLEELRRTLYRLASFDSLTLEARLILVGEDAAHLSRRERRRLIEDKVTASTILDRLRFLGELELFESMSMSQHVLEYLYDKSGRERKTGRALTESQYSAILMNLFENPNKITSLWVEDDFITDYFQNELEDRPRSEKRKKLAMIGRGSVKAGFDMKELQPNMFYINETSRELHFFGFAPKIMNVDINPWFIPEKGIPGFDILTYNGRVNFEDAKKVKMLALNKLETSAIRADILGNAEKFGGESLRSLFSLLTGKPIDKVFFHHDQIIQLSHEIQKDGFVTLEEAIFFEDALRRQLYLIDSLNNTREQRFNNKQLAGEKWRIIQRLCSSLQQLPFEVDEALYTPFSSSFLYSARDGFLDSALRDNLSDLRSRTSQASVFPDSLFHFWTAGDTLLLTQYYNHTVQLLLDLQLEWQGDSGELNQNQTVDAIPTDLSSAKADTFLKESLFPYNYQAQKWDEMVKTGQKSLSSPAKNPRVNLGDRLIICLADREFQLFEVPIAIEQIIHPYLLHGIPPNGSFLLNRRIGIVLPDSPLPESMPNVPLPGLTDRQRSELAAYLERLLVAQSRQKTIGPVERARGWWENKFKGKT